ncbi:RagB/SusD family nutrient uptake outer membrane protein [Pedobacter mucosus]|uniref:RagB/SusD family nutrient uptake outer membrane protein n=1 Tax=Pedobacter mucosus TaxID=2895286 RepID=UPI001EE4CF7A|nr:RagB/SusD family nutrient uptake outer membrane protein [Pedobacter mucosus]UKT65052.1 RagB/SusD family nutrient uptake outer membrane protein [Pedobacter mucosus]
MKIKYTISSGISIVTVFIMACSLIACKKFLDKKPDEKLVVISSVKDMQALLDDYNKMNYNDQAVTEICSDNFYLADATFNARKETDRNLYTWSAVNVFDAQLNAWADTYNTIYQANLVIDRSEALSGQINDETSLASIRAQALFHRGREFLNAVTVWAKDYNPLTASVDLGIPLPVEPDFNIPSKRSNLEESYNQIIKDLSNAAGGLPLQTSTPFRPSKAAAFGLLARACLYKKDYIRAELYADSCLKIKSTLMDYNLLNASANFPIAQLNTEVIFESKMIPASQILQSRAYINPELYGLYADSDLRKTIFFKAGALDFIFKGNYEGGDTFFNGIATDEILLIRAECAARNGKLNIAVSDVNLLRKSRIKSAVFAALNPASTADALTIIKRERRMEFPLRGLRWMDIKRWNAEGDGIILTRKHNSITYTLQPNDLRYAIALPEDIVYLSGMTQNPR